jgi:hypothetical protein
MTLVSVLTLLVLTATLIVAIWYTRETQQIARASVEQSEALQKPCVVIESSARTSDDAVMDAPRVSEVAQTPTVRLKNIGSGLAIGLSYELRQVEVPEGSPAVRPTGFVPYLEAREPWATVTGRGMLTTRIFEFSAEYESLSRSKYQTKIRVDHGLIVSFVFIQCAQQAPTEKQARGRIETALSWLAVIAAFGALYLGVWSLHESRDIALQAEEIHTLLDFAKDDNSAGSEATKQLGSLMREFELANWDTRANVLMHDNFPMRLFMHFELKSSRESEYRMLSDFRNFELHQFQRSLEQTLPQELERIISLPDSERQGAARQLARLLMIGYFAKRFKSRQEGEQEYEGLISDQKKRDRLAQIFNEIDSWKNIRPVGP